MPPHRQAHCFLGTASGYSRYAMAWGRHECFLHMEPTSDSKLAVRGHNFRWLLPEGPLPALRQ